MKNAGIVIGITGLIAVAVVGLFLHTSLRSYAESQADHVQANQDKISAAQTELRGSLDEIEKCLAKLETLYKPQSYDMQIARIEGKVDNLKIQIEELKKSGIALASEGEGARSERADSKNNDIDKLKSPDYKERWNAAVSLIQRRSKTISDLLEILEIDEFPDNTSEQFGKWEAAISLLEDLRAEEAVDFLADNIGFENLAWIDLDDSDTGGLLCVEALIKIGMRSAEQIWANIRYGSPDKKTIQLYVLVLRGIYYDYDYSEDDKKDLRALIEARLKKWSSDEAKANLKELLDNIEFSR